MHKFFLKKKEEERSLIIPGECMNLWICSWVVNGTNAHMHKKQCFNNTAGNIKRFKDTRESASAHLVAEGDLFRVAVWIPSTSLCTSDTTASRTRALEETRKRNKKDFIALRSVPHSWVTRSAFVFCSPKQLPLNNAALSFWLSWGTWKLKGTPGLEILMTDLHTPEASLKVKSNHCRRENWAKQSN